MLFLYLKKETSMHSVFPLFDTIYQETEHIENALNHEEKIKLCDNIKELDEEGHDLVYAIIRTFYLVKENGQFDFIPYSPKIKKSNYKFDATYFPARLLLMIRHFVDLHLHKLREERQIHQLQSSIMM